MSNKTNVLRGSHDDDDDEGGGGGGSSGGNDSSVIVVRILYEIFTGHKPSTN